VEPAERCCDTFKYLNVFFSIGIIRQWFCLRLIAEWRTKLLWRRSISKPIRFIIVYTLSFVHNNHEYNFKWTVTQRFKLSPLFQNILTKISVAYLIFELLDVSCLYLFRCQVGHFLVTFTSHFASLSIILFILSRILLFYFPCSLVFLRLLFPSHEALVQPWVSTITD
jgi:hypothetical protein